MNATTSARIPVRALAFVAAIALALGLAGTGSAAEDRNYLLATATTGGTYYPVGVALATVTKVKLQPEHRISMSAINTAGSDDNLTLLGQNDVQFAILQGLYGYYAWNGKGPLESTGPQTDLRAVSVLWQNVEHFVVRREYAKTGTIEDMSSLKGRKVSLGRKKSGTLGSNEALLGNLGIDIQESFELVYLGYGPSADALQGGQIEAMSTPAGVPVSAVTRALAAMGEDVAMLEFTPEQAKKADGGLGLWIPYKIPAETYPGQAAPLSTIGQANFLAVRADVDEDAVYWITKTIYENLPFLHNIHRATTSMSLNTALSGLPMPLHPGAMRYYREQAMDIPEELIAN